MVVSFGTKNVAKKNKPKKEMLVVAVKLLTARTAHGYAASKSQIHSPKERSGLLWCNSDGVIVT